MVFRKKIFVFILLASLLNMSLANEAKATDLIFAALKFAYQDIKENIGRIAAQSAFNVVANRVMAKMRGGGDQSLFVKNWRNFQIRSQQNGEDIWRGLVYVALNGEGSATPPVICKYIKDSGVINSFQPTQINNLVQKFGLGQRKIDSLRDVLDTLNCDPEVDKKIGVYKNNFIEGGGWDTFTRLLSAQNRPEGVASTLIDELQKQRKLEEKTSVNQAVSGRGFIGSQNCAIQGPGNKCLLSSNIKTPGSVLEGSLVSVFDTSLKFYTTSESIIAGVISSLVNSLISNIFDTGIDDSTVDSNFSINNEASYKAEFCTVKSQMSPAALFFIKNNFPNAYDSFTPILKGLEGYGSFCSERISENNSFPYERCVNACFKAVSVIPENVSVPPDDGSAPEGEVPDNGGGGGAGPCSDKGGTANYQGDLQTVINAVINTNIGGIANALNTTENSFRFLNSLAFELQQTGFNSIVNVLNGNSNPNRGDLIALWRSNDSTMERYDVINSAGNGNLSIRQAAQNIYTGDIPLTCTQ